MNYLYNPYRQCYYKLLILRNYYVLNCVFSKNGFRTGLTV